MPEVPIASKHIKDALATDARNLGQCGATIGRWSAMRGRHQQSGCSPYGDGPIGYWCEPRVKIGPVPPRRARTSPTIVGTVNRHHEYGMKAGWYALDAPPAQGEYIFKPLRRQGSLRYGTAVSIAGGLYAVRAPAGDELRFKNYQAHYCEWPYDAPMREPPVSVNVLRRKIRNSRELDEARGISPNRMRSIAAATRPANSGHNPVGKSDSVQRRGACRDEGNDSDRTMSLNDAPCPKKRLRPPC
jgi:hypothetical protein